MYHPIPNSTIKLLKGVPLQINEPHTIWWDDPSGQEAYFSGKAKYTFEKAYYVREERAIRVPQPIDDIVDCNYVMYRNTSYTDKWYYGFITNLIYKNDNLTLVQFEIDVMQTYFFNHILKHSMVLRNHIAPDNIGANRTPESLGFNYYECGESYDEGRNLFQTWAVKMVSTFNPFTFEDVGAPPQNSPCYSALGVYTIGRVEVTLGAFAWTLSPEAVITDLVRNHAEKVDGVLAIIMTPESISSSTTPKSLTIPKLVKDKPYSSTFTPKNAKMYTAPYSVLWASDGNGGGKNFVFEDFNSAVCEFLLSSDKSPNESILCTPVRYRGVNRTGYFNTKESIVMGGMPQCAWISDAYKQYLAENKSSLILSGISSAAQIIGGVGSIIFGNPLGGAMIGQGLASAINMGSNMYQKSRESDNAHGNVSTTTFFTIGEKCIRFEWLHCDEPSARIIDDYFTMFGYAINRIELPQRNVRPHYTYLQTADVDIEARGTGGCNAQVLKALADIYNKGITFWRNPNEIGDYSVDNRA